MARSTRSGEGGSGIFCKNSRGSPRFGNSKMDNKRSSSMFLQHKFWMMTTRNKGFLNRRFLVVLGVLNLEEGRQSEMGKFTNNLCLFDFGITMIPDHLYNSINLNRKRFLWHSTAACWYSKHPPPTVKLTYVLETQLSRKHPQEDGTKWKGGLFSQWDSCVSGNFTK